MFERTITTFNGVDGTQHRIGYCKARGELARSGRLILCDEWEGHGVRLLLSMRDEEGEAQADAVLEEYRIEAATSDRPLSREVAREEISQIAGSLA